MWILSFYLVVVVNILMHSDVASTANQEFRLEGFVLNEKDNSYNTLLNGVKRPITFHTREAYVRSSFLLDRDILVIGYGSLYYGAYRKWVKENTFKMIDTVEIPQNYGLAKVTALCAGAGYFRVFFEFADSKRAAVWTFSYYSMPSDFKDIPHVVNMCSDKDDWYFSDNNVYAAGKIIYTSKKSIRQVYFDNDIYYLDTDNNLIHVEVDLLNRRLTEKVLSDDVIRFFYNKRTATASEIYYARRLYKNGIQNSDIYVLPLGGLKRVLATITGPLVQDISVSAVGLLIVITPIQVFVYSANDEKFVEFVNPSVNFLGGNKVVFFVDDSAATAYNVTSSQLSKPTFLPVIITKVVDLMAFPMSNSLTILDEYSMISDVGFSVASVSANAPPRSYTRVSEKLTVGALSYFYGILSVGFGASKTVRIYDQYGSQSKGNLWMSSKVPLYAATSFKVLLSGYKSSDPKYHVLLINDKVHFLDGTSIPEGPKKVISCQVYPMKYSESLSDSFVPGYYVLSVLVGKSGLGDEVQLFRLELIDDKLTVKQIGIYPLPNDVLGCQPIFSENEPTTKRNLFFRNCLFACSIGLFVLIEIIIRIRNLVKLGEFQKNVAETL